MAGLAAGIFLPLVLYNQPYSELHMQPILLPLVYVVHLVGVDIGLLRQVIPLMAGLVAEILPRGQQYNE
jgi:hypothetical protein